MMFVLRQLRKNVTGETDITRRMRHFALLGTFGVFLITIMNLYKIFLGHKGNQGIDITRNLKMEI